MTEQTGLPRRTFLKRTAATGVVLAAGSGTLIQALSSAKSLGAAPAAAPNAVTPNKGGIYIEAYPTSPLIVTPFVDPLPLPTALRPVPASEVAKWANKPGPGKGLQDSGTGTLKNITGDGGTHQLWPTNAKVGQTKNPLVYQIKLQVAQHNFTTSRVRPINSLGQPVALPAGAPVTLDAQGTTHLPAGTIYGFSNNGGLSTFPGPMINAEYGRAALVRIENHLDENPFHYDRQDFGAPDNSFLTHLHNGHTAPESDGNPHYRMLQTMALGMTEASPVPGAPPQLGVGGYLPQQFCDNLYLNWPAGNDSREMQTTFWFHDHKMDFTGSNVYKGMVGFYPIYDPAIDRGNENVGLRLPGVRTNHTDGSFDVQYDIPIILYDCRLDDGVTPHKDMHSGNGETHAEWWGKTFYKHFPNHGFVGDLFTVNGTAFPVLNVKRRKYRFRFLDASISRIYELSLMTSTQGPRTAASLGFKADDLQGQYRIPDGQLAMRFTQIASEGGLLPAPIVRDRFELWPAKRREFVVDFTRYRDGTPTKKGDVLYLTNSMRMPNGRMWSNSTRFSPDPSYKIPLMKIVIGGTVADNSRIPAVLRPLVPNPVSSWQNLPRRTFTLQRGSAAGDPEIEWLINNQPFVPDHPLATPKFGSSEVWIIRNGGGGWVHPMHLHMEEHRVVLRNNAATPAAGHPDDRSREDVVALDPSEEVWVKRSFRDFVGPYVGHCHNLAHEDHAMMFGWSIVP